jgi:hypothetical protein
MMLVVMIGLGGASPVSDLVSEPMEDSMALIARLVLPACRDSAGRFRPSVTSLVTRVTGCRSVRVLVVMLRLSSGSARLVELRYW